MYVPQCILEIHRSAEIPRSGHLLQLRKAQLHKHVNSHMMFGLLSCDNGELPCIFEGQEILSLVKVEVG